MASVASDHFGIRHRYCGIDEIAIIAVLTIKDRALHQ
jgi:hypothetical protein